MLHVLFSSLCPKYISFGFIEALDSKQKNVSGHARIIGREITTVLKIAVDTVTCELCDSRDYFASPFLVKKSDLI